MNHQYIYLIREREFLKNNEDIYKIGKTSQEPNIRFQNYPKGSELLLTVKVSNCDDYERKIKALFNINYQQCKDIGIEYFKGSGKQMMTDIFNIIKDDNPQVEIKSDIELIAIYKDLIQVYPQLKKETAQESIELGIAIINQDITICEQKIVKSCNDFNMLQNDISTWRSSIHWANGVSKYRKQVEKFEKLIQQENSNRQELEEQKKNLTDIKNRIDNYRKKNHLDAI